MTIRNLGSAMLRRWYVVVFFLVVALVAGFVLARSGGIYTSETVVSFTLPTKTTLSPDSGLDDSSVIAFAGLVAQEVNNGKAPESYSSDDAPYYGAGVRQGVLVSLPNAGNQWVTSYLRAEIVLQIVGPSRQWVAQTQSDLLTKVVQVAAAQQVDVKSAKSRIQADPVPLTKKIFHIVPSRSSVIAAFFALLVVALIVGGWASVLVDQRVRRRNMRTGRRMPSRVANEGPER